MGVRQKFWEGGDSCFIYPNENNSPLCWIEYFYNNFKKHSPLCLEQSCYLILLSDSKHPNRSSFSMAIYWFYPTPLASSLFTFSSCLVPVIRAPFSSVGFGWYSRHICPIVDLYGTDLRHRMPWKWAHFLIFRDRMALAISVDLTAVG